ncbi:MAG TPA: type II secretion system F family protein [Verrucomicrobiota bacterium]|nr:type II secretion system F family protein [Verrucomicrobiota bacterium]
MPVYYYKSVDREGNIVTGVMEAASENALEDKLQSIGFYLLQARLEIEREQREVKMSLWRVNRRNLIEFFTQMNVQLKAGVPLIQALEVAVEECDNVRFRLILDAIHRNVLAGSLFYEALEKYPESFQPYMVSLIRAGEMSGRLPDTFKDLQDYLEWLDRVINDVRQASVYPAIVLSVVGTFVLALFTFVIPKFMELMKVARVQVPPLTQFIFGLSTFAKDTWWLWFSILIGGVIFFKVAYRVLPGFAELIDNIKLKIPLLGEINRMIALSRFAHNLALMYRAGIPILQALRLCAGLVGNTAVEKAVRGVENTVTAGESIGDSMRRHKVFSSLLRRMVALGEVSGKLDETLELVAAYYNEAVPRKIKRLFSIAEPAVMLCLIAIVGSVALSIFMPLIGMMGGIR